VHPAAEAGASTVLERDERGPEAAASLRSLIGELPGELRDRAVTHSSWTERRVDSWGRLAFLGDAVLGLVVGAALFDRFPRSDIGRLTKIHGQAVSGRACAEVALWLEVPDLLAERRERTHDAGISVPELLASERAMASIVESLIGAVYLDRGLEEVAPAVLAAFEPQIELASKTMLDFKSALQELLARRGELVTYVVAEEDGPPHDRRFVVEATVDGAVLGSGSGASKKAAEQAAAADALAALKA
jgi:ribonuclease III